MSDSAWTALTVIAACLCLTLCTVATRTADVKEHVTDEQQHEFDVLHGCTYTGFWLKRICTK